MQEFYRVDGRKIRLLPSVGKLAIRHKVHRAAQLRHKLNDRHTALVTFSLEEEVSRWPQTERVDQDRTLCLALGFSANAEF